MPDDQPSALAQTEIIRFLGVDSAHFEDFLRQVKDIKLGIQAIDTNTKIQEDSLSKLVSFYTEQKGMSPTPSRAVAEGATPQASGLSRDASIGANIISGIPAEGQTPSASTTGGPSKPPNALRALKTMVTQGGAGYLHEYGTQGMAGTGGTRAIDDNNDEEDEVPAVLGHHVSGGAPEGSSTPPGGTGTGGTGGASSGASGPQATAQNFLDVVGPMSVPRAGEFTIQNMVEQMARYTAGQAANADTTDQANQYLGYTSFLNRAATQWVPTASMVSQYGSQLQQYGQQAINYGESVQGQPVGASTASTNVGPVRLPITLPSLSNPLPGGTLVTGLTSHISDLFQGAVTPGLSSDQIAQIRESLAQQGFNEQAGPITGMANSMFRNLTQLSPEIGMNPEVQSMGVDNLRYAQASVSQLSQTLGQDLVTAANSANVSFSQMASDMQAYGEWSQQNGGTAFSGQMLAQQVADSTGLPADTFLPMMSSPITQAMAMTKGGVPPWAIGTLPVGQQQGLAMQGFNLAASTVKGMPGATENVDGIKIHTSGSAVQAATMNQLYYGGQMKNSVLQKMIENPNYAKGVQEAGNATDAFRAVSGQIGNEYRAGIAKDGTPTQSQAAKLQKDTADSLTKLHDIMRTEIDPTTGKKVFSASDRHTLWDSYKNDTAAPDQRMSTLLNNFKKAQAGKIGSSADASMAKAAGGPQIGLTPQAAKFFQIQTNGSMDPTKMGANSGDGSTVNSVFDKATSVANTLLPGSPGNAAQGVENTVASLLP